MRRSRFVALVTAFVMAMNCHAGAYTLSQTRKESPQDFNDFLADCTTIERIQLLQTLKDFPDLKDEYFGKLKGLPPLNRFTTDKNKASSSLPLKPSSFNEVLPETVYSALLVRTCSGVIRKSTITASSSGQQRSPALTASR